MSKLYAYLDSNVFLHFRSMCEIPWCEVLEAEEVELVVPFQVLRELEDKKDHGSSKLRKRARSAISEIKAVCPPGCPSAEVSLGVTLRVRHQEPQVDWEQEHLDESKGDDRILAEMMEEAHENVLIVGHDTALQYKAMGREFHYCELPSRYRLSEEPTEEERKILELEEFKRKRELVEPNLTLGFLVDGGLIDYLRVVLPEFDVVDLDSEVEKRMEELKVSGPKPNTPQGSMVPRHLSILMESFAPTPPASEYDRYQRELKEFREEFREYVEAVETYRRLRSLSFRLPLTISNHGSAPACSVAVSVHIGDGLRVLAADDFPEAPEEPDPPGKPRSPAEINSRSVMRMTDLSILNRPVSALPKPAVPNPDATQGPHIEPSNSYDVKWSVPKIKHHSDHALPPLWIVFPKDEGPRNFGFTYRMIADNHADPFEGTLHVVIE